MPSDAVVTAADLTRARGELRRDGIAPLMDALEQTQPEMFDFILRASHCVAGRLALMGVAPPSVREAADDLLDTVLTCLVAMRQSHARAWESAQNRGDKDVPF